MSRLINRIFKNIITIIIISEKTRFTLMLQKTQIYSRSNTQILFFISFIQEKPRLGSTVQWSNQEPKFLPNFDLTIISHGLYLCIFKYCWTSCHYAKIPASDKEEEWKVHSLEHKLYPQLTFISLWSDIGKVANPL